MLKCKFVIGTRMNTGLWNGYEVILPVEKRGAAVHWTVSQKFNVINIKKPNLKIQNMSHGG